MQSFIQKSRICFFSLLFCSLAFLLSAQAPILLKDINATLDGAPRNVVTVGNTVFLAREAPFMATSFGKQTVPPLVPFW